MSKRDNCHLAELQNLRIISDFATDLLSLTTLEQVLWHLAKKVIARLGFSDVVIYLFDPVSNKLVQKAAYGSKSPEAESIVEPINISLGEGVVGKAAQSRQPLVIADTREYPGYIPDIGAGLSELAVPMLMDGDLIGVIDSEHPNACFYTASHLQTVQAIASLAATKIVQAQTLSKLQLSLEALEYSSKIQNVLFEIAELIFQSSTMSDFYRQLHKSISKLTFAENFYVALLQENGRQLSIPYCIDKCDGNQEGGVIASDPSRPNLTAYVLHLDKPMLLNEQEISDLISKGEISMLGTLPKMWLGVPFGDAGLHGVVAVQSYAKNNVFSEKDKQLLMFVSKHIRNAIERFQSRADLNFLALHDPLTHLPNRNLFSDRVGQAIAKCDRDPRYRVAVLYVDLDRFKHVNDTYGHQVGDKLLISLAAKLRACVREMDTLCRIGGDEFAVLLESDDGLNSAVRVGSEMVKVVRKVQKIDGLRLRVSASIGVALYDESRPSLEKLLSQADDAMYQAKLLGRNQVCTYVESSLKKHSSNHRLERDFKRGIKAGELYLLYQPIVDIQVGLIVGAEALVRWRHREHGELAPDTFIDSLEKTGQIVDLDVWVLNQALEWLGRENTLTVSINVSSLGLCSLEFMAELHQVQRSFPERLNRLCLEITERSFVDAMDHAREILMKIQSMGVSVAIDDFGTGYSSLSYLHHFDFDRLKIDRAFVVELDSNNDKEIILSTIINLAQALGIMTVAEGIEEEEQYRCLQSLGCQFGQGYLMDRPMAPEVFLEVIKTGKRYMYGGKQIGS